MKKRIFSFLLAFVMVIGMVPATALTASAAAMTTSEAGISYIKEFEGFHDKAYWDNGQWTIGYGTSSTEGATITREEADAAMREHLKTMENAVNTFAGANSLTLSQAQFDALVSFSYNCGTAWTSGSGKFRSAVINKTTGNDFLYAICLWANVGGVPSAGLLNRRLSEANLYLNGQYSKNPPANYTYVIFDANGGDAGEEKMQGFDSTTSAAIKSVPTKSGQAFAGWFTEKTGGSQVVTLSSAQAGKTLYAQWGIKTTVTNSYVNVRNAAGLNGTIVTAKLNQGDQVVIVETKSIGGELWGRYSGGWVCLKYTNYGTASNVPSEGENAETVVAKATVSCRTTVNVRNQPGVVGTSVIGSMANGTKVDLYEIKTVSGTKWGRYNGGWFCLDYAVVTEQSQTNSGTGSDTGSDTGNDTGSEDAGTVQNTGTVSNSYVNVRNAAGTSGTTVLGQLNKGDKVSIYEFTTAGGRQWGRIGVNRWVCLEYVKLDPVSSGAGTGSGGTDAGSVQRTGTVSNSYVNVRNAAGTSGTIVLGQLNKGDRVNIYEMKTVGGRQWGRIDGNRWICLEYVSLDAQGSTGSDSNTGTGSNTGSGTGTGTNSGTTVTPDSNAIATGIVTSTNLNIRCAAGLGYGTVGSLYKNNTFNLYEIRVSGNMIWGRIGTDKWVCLSYTVLNSTSNTGKGEMGTVIKTGYGVNFRTGAGAGYTALGKILVNSRIEILETKKVGITTWGRTSVGWVSMEYVMLDSQLPPELIPGAGTGSNTGSDSGTNAGTGSNTDTDSNTNTGTGSDTGSGNISGTGTVLGGGTGNGSTTALYTGKVILTNALRIRQEPSTASAELGTLTKGTAVTIYETAISQYMAWGRTDRGWICLVYVDLLPASGNGAIDARVVQYDGLNIREAAGTTHKSVGTYAKAEIVDIYEFSGNWARTDKGWVNLDYLLT